VSLTLCHTADWHLGRTLHGVSLEPAQRRYLSWLVDQLVAASVDVLVVAGDVFDRSVPSASAEELFFGFLADLAERAPGLEVVVVAGNHDGASRLAAPSAVLGRLGVRIVGSVPTRRGEDGRSCLDLGACVVPLRDRRGTVHGRLLALPFLRPSDLSLVSGVSGDADMLTRVSALHRQAVGQVHDASGSLTIATAHAHVRGARLSPDSERMLLGGEEASWPLDVFPQELDYVAAGHLHLAQSLDGGRVRYSGAPLPLAFSERDLLHEIVILRLLEPDAALMPGEERIGRLAARGVRVPAFLRLVRVEGSPDAPDGVEGLARALSELVTSGTDEGRADGSHPEPRAPTVPGQEVWVQARVPLDGPRPALRQELAHALARAPHAEGEPPPRLVHVDVVRARVQAPTGITLPSALSPSAVLEHVWRTSIGAGTRASEPVPRVLRDALDAAWLEATRRQDEDDAEGPEEVAS